MLQHLLPPMLINQTLHVILFKTSSIYSEFNGALTNSWNFSGDIFLFKNHDTVAITTILLALLCVIGLQLVISPLTMNKNP